MIIHGLYGNGKELAEESSGSWTHQYLKSFCPGSRLILFEWESRNIFAGVEICALIRALSRCLLQGLSNVGGESSTVCASKFSILAMKLTQECFRDGLSCLWLMIWGPWY